MQMLDNIGASNSGIRWGSYNDRSFYCALGNNTFSCIINGVVPLSTVIAIIVVVILCDSRNSNVNLVKVTSPVLKI